MQYNLQWDQLKCVKTDEICVDRGVDKSDNSKRLMTKLNVSLVIHCIIHQQILFGKRLNLSVCWNIISEKTLTSITLVETYSQFYIFYLLIHGIYVFPFVNINMCVYILYENIISSNLGLPKKVCRLLLYVIRLRKGCIRSKWN